MGGGTPHEIRVSVKVQRGSGHRVTDPSDHSVVFGGMDVANQAMESPIAVGSPLGNEAREMANRAKKIEAGHASGIHDLHEHPSRDGLKGASILCGVLGSASTTWG